MRYLIPSVVLCLLALAIGLLSTLMIKGVAAGGGPLHTGVMGWAYDYQTLLAGIFVVSGAFLAFAGTLRTTYLAETENLAKQAIARSRLVEEGLRLTLLSFHHIARATKLKSDASDRPLRIAVIAELPAAIADREGDVRSLGVHVLTLLGDTVRNLREFNDFSKEAEEHAYVPSSETGYPAGEILYRKNSITWERTETAAEAYLRLARQLQKSATELSKACTPYNFLQRQWRWLGFKLERKSGNVTNAENRGGK